MKDDIVARLRDKCFLCAENVPIVGTRDHDDHGEISECGMTPEERDAIAAIEAERTHAHGLQLALDEHKQTCRELRAAIEARDTQLHEFRVLAMEQGWTAVGDSAAWLRMRCEARDAEIASLRAEVENVTKEAAHWHSTAGVLNSERVTLRARLSSIRGLLAPNCDEETVEGAIRNLQQALLSTQGNLETTEAERDTLRAEVEAKEAQLRSEIEFSRVIARLTAEGLTGEIDILRAAIKAYFAAKDAHDVDGEDWDFARHKRTLNTLNTEEARLRALVEGK